MRGVVEFSGAFAAAGPRGRYPAAGGIFGARGPAAKALFQTFRENFGGLIHVRGAGLNPPPKAQASGLWIDPAHMDKSTKVLTIP